MKPILWREGWVFYVRHWLLIKVARYKRIVSDFIKARIDCSGDADFGRGGNYEKRNTESYQRVGIQTSDPSQIL
jgi:hypothetical protein